MHSYWWRLILWCCGWLYVVQLKGTCLVSYRRSFESSLDCRYVGHFGVWHRIVFEAVTKVSEEHTTRESQHIGHKCMQNVKHAIFEPGKKRLFLNISTTNIDTRVPSLYQSVETRCIEVFWLLSQPLPHLVGQRLRLSNVLERISRPSCEPLYGTNISHPKQETFLHFPYNISFTLSPFAHKNRTRERCSSNTVAILTTETIIRTCAFAAAIYTVMKLNCSAT
jgi:hypothetical protein